MDIFKGLKWLEKRFGIQGPFGEASDLLTLRQLNDSYGVDLTKLEALHKEGVSREGLKLFIEDAKRISETPSMSQLTALLAGEEVSTARHEIVKESSDTEWQQRVQAPVERAQARTAILETLSLYAQTIGFEKPHLAAAAVEREYQIRRAIVEREQKRSPGS